MLTGMSPKAVALYGIDFAVVRQETERLCQFPLWPSVGGKTLMENRQTRLKPFIV